MAPAGFATHSARRGGDQWIAPGIIVSEVGLSVILMTGLSSPAGLGRGSACAMPLQITTNNRTQ